MGYEISEPMEGLAPLSGEVLGAERAPILLESRATGWIVRVGNDTDRQGTTERAPEAQEPVTLTGIFAHPAGGVLTVTPGADVRSSMFGIEWSGTAERVHRTVLLGRPDDE